MCAVNGGLGRKLCHHLLAMQSSLLLEYVLSDGKVEVLIPNFSKIFRKIPKQKFNQKSPNKRKENKIKENKIKVKENNNDDDRSKA